MHLRNLKVFCDVVGRHSFSKAAADNDMTQSGASQAVQQLEEHLQVQLIDRSKRPFLLTAEGSAFHAGCVQILRQFETLTEEVRAIGNEMTGRASMAAIYSVGLSYLPELQRAIKTRHPKAEVRYQFAHPDEIYRLVEQGMVDFGLVSYPQSSKTIAATEWREETMWLVAPQEHPLAAKAEIQPADLASETLVAFAPNLRIRHEIDRYLRQLGITMQVAAELDNIDSVKHAMEVHSAVSFLPEPTVREEIRAGTVLALNCPWLQLSRPLGLIQRKNCMLGRTARGVMELILANVHPPPAEGQEGSPTRPVAKDAVAAQNANPHMPASTSHARRVLATPASERHARQTRHSAS
ncbi:MAG: LysR family transcriptional regulator [Planctomycetales bacterium]|nr:LysR family transcriptional regulator [Planctomycetales bacterium]